MFASHLGGRGRTGGFDDSAEVQDYGAQLGQHGHEERLVASEACAASRLSETSCPAIRALEKQPAVGARGWKMGLCSLRNV